MILRDAKNVARQWVDQEVSKAPGFRGAFFHGSANWLSDQADLPSTSDLDVMVVFDEDAASIRTGKLVHGDVLLEISRFSSEQLRSPEVVLSDYRLAGSFHVASVIADPSGQLSDLQAAVAKDYAKRSWVRARCEHARDNVLKHLGSSNESAPFHDQVTAWLFGTGVTTHVLLVAGLKNPTVRSRYQAARELLADYGRLDFYETFLGLLGCAQISRTHVENHFDAMTDAFDAAKIAIKTPFFFASDITDIARPVAIDGTRELIERGFHREAVFWLVATYSRCQQVFYQDASNEIQQRFDRGYRDLLADLGIDSPEDLAPRSQQVREFLLQLMEVSEAIMDANPEIEYGSG